MFFKHTYIKFFTQFELITDNRIKLTLGFSTKNPEQAMPELTFLLTFASFNFSIRARLATSSKHTCPDCQQKIKKNAILRAIKGIE